MKKILNIVIALLLTICILAACGQSAAPSGQVTQQATTVAATQATTTEATTQAPTTQSGPEDNTLPIVTEPLTLRFWAQLGRSAISLSTFDDMLAYQELQKRTGITIEFIHPPVGGETEQFNLLVASRDLPDMIEHSWRSVSGGPGAYIKDDIIIPLNDLLDQYAPNLLQTYKDIPQARKEAIMDDGTHYMFPCLYVSPELQHATGPVLRGDWLKQMGEEEPETIDEWYELLLKVKDTTFNGNTDVIPFTLNGKDDFNGTHIFIGAWGITTRYSQENGKIVFGPTDPRFIEFLELMNDWYDKGLLDSEFAANVAKDKDDKVMGDKAFAFIGSMGNEVTRYTGTMRQSNPDFLLLPQLYPVLTKGTPPLLGSKSFIATGSGVAITTACKNVKEAVKLMDYNFSWDGLLLGNFGIEGVTYNLVNGEPVYTDLILNNPDGLDISSAISKYCYHSGNSALPKPNWVTNQRDSLPEQLEGRKRWMATVNDLLVPPLLPTLDESTEYSQLMNTINSYVDEMLVNFIMGRTPLSDYDSFVSTLKSMNIDRAVEIMQAQMDRYSNR